MLPEVVGVFHVSIGVLAVLIGAMLLAFCHLRVMTQKHIVADYG